MSGFSIRLEQLNDMLLQENTLDTAISSSLFDSTALNSIKSEECKSVEINQEVSYVCDACLCF